MLGGVGLARVLQYAVLEVAEGADAGDIYWLVSLSLRHTEKWR